MVGIRDGLTLSGLLRALFGIMLLLVVGALALPIVRDIRELSASAEMTRMARTGRTIFTAMQNLRLNRGPTRTALEAKEPASEAFAANRAARTAKAAPALAALLEDCRTIDCIGTDRGLVI